jgi:hypothetical protein
MAITAHYSAKSSKSGNIIIRTQLVAFRQLQGSHSGVNIGKVFLQVIKEIGCLNKVSLKLHKLSLKSLTLRCTSISFQ